MMDRAPPTITLTQPDDEPVATDNQASESGRLDVDRRRP